MINSAVIPIQWVGPILINSAEISGDILVPFATLETPLWPSTTRGGRATRTQGGIQATVVSECMTRSVVVEATSAGEAALVSQQIQQSLPMLQHLVQQTGRFVQLEAIHTQIVANILYVRFSMKTGDASGHNMVTKASDALLKWILESSPTLRYISVSGNFCTDKKVSAVNGILGRGKYVVAEVLIPHDVCLRVLKNTPQAIVDLNIKKNLLGSILAGSLRSANAHFANMLLAFYLATGQDPANIVEGSQGIVHAEVRGRDLYFSVTLPNLILGTVGNGKHAPHALACLDVLGCLPSDAPGASARRLAVICASAVLCGELSLLAALTCQGELMAAHLKYERLGA
jgi:hydroxymethylglutaryl-CoA reductase (NADPH)